MLGEEDGYTTAIHLAHSHFRDFMSSNLEIIHVLVDAMLAIVQSCDVEVYAKLAELSVPPFFCVSWMLTWFAHDVDSVSTAQSMFDFFIANHPSAIIYASAVLH